MNNQFQFIGRLTKNVELRTNGTTTIAEVNIAINNKKDDVTYIKMKAFNKTAEMLDQYTKMGDLVGFTGMIANNNWQDKEGKKHYEYNFVISRVMFLQTKAKSKVQAKETQTDQDILKKIMQEEQEDPYEQFASELPF